MLKSRNGFLKRKRSKAKKSKRNRSLIVQTLESRQMLASDWTNPVVWEDVNVDGRISPLDALNVINELSRQDDAFRQLPPLHSAGMFYYDVSGDGRASALDALRVINAIGRGEELPLRLNEDTTVGSEGLSISVGERERETRKYQFRADANWGTQSNTDLKDSIAVYIQGVSGENAFGLDNSQSLLTITPDGVFSSSGRYRFDGELIELDLTGAGDLQGAQLEFRPLWTGAGGSQITITPVSNDVSLTATSSELQIFDRFYQPGPSVDLADYSSTTSFSLSTEQVSFDKTSGITSVTALLKNLGTASIGQDSVLVLSGLPAGIELINRSGDASGPYITLSNVIQGRWLSAGGSSLPIELQFSGLATKLPTSGIQLLTPPGNQAPQLASVQPVEASIGATTRIDIEANDPNGDLVALTLDSTSGFASLDGGQLVLSPRWGDEGSHTLEIVASDGFLSARTQIEITVPIPSSDSTRISGKVLDVNSQPLDGIPVELGGFSSTTDATGSFEITLPTLLVPTEDFDISVPTGDVFLDPFNTGTQSIPFRRARFEPGTGTDILNPRQHPNLVSSFLDASIVYGFESDRADAIRTFVGGKLKTDAGNLLPANNSSNFPGGPLENDNEGRSDPATLFASGDTRTNENVGLISLHTLLVREHNRLVEQFAIEDPLASDEELYQRARHIVIGIVQQITYNEYLPALLGENAIAPYTGYNAAINPSESALFAVAAFRIGHSQVFSEIPRLDAAGNSLPGGSVQLKNAFFNPDLIRDDGIEPYLRGLTAAESETIDPFVIDDLRNFLFGPPGSGGMDLAAMNIQRGRDMGLPSYNQARIDFGLAPASTFSDISANPTVVSALSNIYASVDDVEVWIGGLSEDHMPGAQVGELFAHVIADQFTRTRDGDRYWYQNSQFTQDELNLVEGTTLRSLIERNSEITSLPENVFSPGSLLPSQDGNTSAAQAQSDDYRSINGEGNNQAAPETGATGTRLLQNFTLSYGDGYNSPGGEGLPNARAISNAVFAQSSSMPSSGFSGLAVYWGQLIDHDLGLTPGGVSDTLKVHGELRAGTESYPYVAEKLDLILGRDAFVGVNNVVDRPIYLPALDIDNGVMVDPSRLTSVTTTAIPSAQLDIAAGTLKMRDGSLFEDVLSITEVPRDLTPASLPDDLIPELVVTIQPADMVFSTPAPLSLPNAAGYDPGAIVDLYSINPVTGEFDDVGDGMVSQDGSRITTISGGVRNSSWHFFSPPKPAPPKNNPKDQNRGCPTCPLATGNASSLFEFQSGALIEQHDLVTYNSLGQERGVSLVYDSLRADPRPIIHFGYDRVTSTFQDVYLAGRILGTHFSSVGIGVSIGLGESTNGLHPTENIWSIPDGQTTARGAIQLDLRTLATGLYEFDVLPRLLTKNGDQFRNLANYAYRDFVAHVNTKNSVFGAGWGVAGLKEAILKYEVTGGGGGGGRAISIRRLEEILIVDGDGSEVRYVRDSLNSNRFTSGDSGDYSELWFENGILEHRMTDGTVYSFEEVIDNNPNDALPNALQLKSTTDRNGNSTQFKYDNGIGITEIIDPVGLSTTFAYTDGKVVSITDPAGRTTYLTHDTENLVGVTDPDATSRVWNYDELGHMTGETTKRGFTQQAFFEFSGRAYEAVREDGQRIRFQPIQTIGLLPPRATIDVENPPPAFERLETTVTPYIDANGNLIETTIDGRGQPSQKQDVIGPINRVVRNSENQIVKSFDARGNVTEFRYDERGNVIEIIDEITDGSTSIVTPTITWTGADDNRWNNPLNWDELRIPIESDSVLLRQQSSIDTMVIVDEQNVSIASVDSTVPLVVSNSIFTISQPSRLQNDVLLSGGGVIQAIGTDARLTLLGALAEAVGSFVAGSGGQIDFPELAELIDVDGTKTLSIVADGTGSEITFPSLSQLDVLPQRFVVESKNGGFISLNELDSPVGLDLRSTQSGVIAVDSLTTLLDGAIALGNGTIIGIEGLESIGNSHISVSDGSQIQFPSLTTFLEPTTTTPVISVSGDGTSLSFPVLDRVLDEGTPSLTHFEVRDGGTLSIPVLTTLPSSSFMIQNDSKVEAPMLEIADNSIVDIGASSIFTAPNLARMKGADIRIRNASSFSFSKISNFDFSSLNVQDATVSLPLLTSYSEPDRLAGISSLVVSGPNGILSFPNLSTFVDPGEDQAGTLFRASDAATLNLPKLVSSNSAIFEVATGGTANLPELVDASKSRIIVLDTGVIAAPKLTTLEFGNLRIDAGATFPAALISDLDYSSVDIRNTSVSFPLVTSYSEPTFLAGISALVVSGANGLLSFPNLSTFVDPGADQAGTLFRASDAATLNLPKLVSSNSAIFEVATGGTVNLPELVDASASRITVGIGNMSVPKLATAVGANFTVSTDSAILLPELQNADGSTIQVLTNGQFNAPKLNGIQFGDIRIHAGAIFPADQITELDYSSIDVREANVSFPLVTSYAKPEASNTGSTIQVSGTGASLSFPNLTTFVSSANARGFTTFRAGAGTTLELLKLSATNSAGLIAQGGRIVAPELVDGSGSRLEVNPGGEIAAAKLAIIQAGDIVIDAGGLFPASQITNLDFSGVNVRNTSVSFPLITSYAEPTFSNSASTVQVSGQDGMLAFPNLSSFVDAGPVSSFTDFRATSGATLLLPLLSVSNTANFTAIDGTIELPELNSAIGSQILLYGTGTLEASKLLSIAGSRLRVTDSAIFPSDQLTDITGAYITAEAGASLSFAGITSYLLPLSGETIWESGGDGAEIVFPNLTNVVANSPTTGTLRVITRDSGISRFPALDTISTGTSQFTAFRNATVYLPSLATTDGVVLNADDSSQFIFDEAEGEVATTGLNAVATGVFIGPLQASVSQQRPEGETTETTDAEANPPVLPRTFRYDPRFNQLVYESDELGRQTFYQIDPANGNVLAVTNEVGERHELPDPNVSEVSSVVRDIQIVDLNGDTLKDWVSIRDNAVLYSINSDDGFLPVQMVSAGEPIRAVAAAEIDNVNGIDLIVTTESGKGMLLRNQGDDTFDVEEVAALTQVFTIVAIDVDGDDDVEFVALTRGPTTARNVISLIVVGSGGGISTQELSTVASTSNFRPRTIAADDYDNDGLIDFAVGSQQYDIFRQQFQDVSQITIAWGDGSDRPLNQTLAPSFRGVSRLESLDTDGDSVPEIISTLSRPQRESSDPGISLFEFQQDQTVEKALFGRYSPSITDAVAVDINGDGLKDLISIQRGTEASFSTADSPGTLHIQLATPGGGLLDRFSISIADDPRQVIATDVNGDGTIDIVTRHDGETEGSEVHTIFSAHEYFFGRIGSGDDQITQFTHTDRGLVDTMTDPLGRITDYDYDQFGRLTTTTMAKGTPDEVVYRNEYDQATVGGRAGRPTASIDANGNRTEIIYHAMNDVEVISEPDPDGNGPLESPETTFFYDEEMNLTLVLDPLGSETRYEYDERNRQTTLIEADPDGAGPLESPVTRYEYDANDNLLSITDPLGHVSRNEYDARNRLIKSIDPDGGEILYEYDLDGNLVALTDPVGNRTEFAYDSRNRMTLELDPLAAKIQYQYDGANNLTTKIDRLGRVTEFSYDDLDRLVSENWFTEGSIVNTITSTYNLVGNLKSIEDQYSKLAFTYDNLDRVKSADNMGPPGAPPVLLEYQYDSNGNVTSVIDTIDGTAGATTEYVYDALDRLITLQQSGNEVADKLVDFHYNEIGQYTSIERYSDLTRTALSVDTTYLYDELHRLTDLTHSNASDDVLSFFNYDYDIASRITQIEDVHGTTEYSYDDRNQLTGADRGDSDDRGDESYAYDANGNRESSYLHGNAYVTGDANRLLSDGTYSYEYDAEGNTIKRTEIVNGNYRDFEWDHRNRLTRVSDYLADETLTQEVTFTYDALNRRIAKVVASSGSVNATHFVYDGEDVILDFVDPDGSGLGDEPTLDVRYLHGLGIDEVISQESLDTDEQWLLPDQLGSIQAIVFASGQLATEYKYNSFGGRDATGQEDSRYGFTGREYDSEINLQFFRSRYYVSSSGGFLTEDRVGFSGGDTNLFGYVMRSPVNAVDPLGTAPSQLAKYWWKPSNTGQSERQRQLNTPTSAKNAQAAPSPNMSEKIRRKLNPAITKAKRYARDVKQFAKENIGPKEAINAAGKVGGMTVPATLGKPILEPFIDNWLSPNENKASIPSSSKAVGGAVCGE